MEQDEDMLKSGTKACMFLALFCPRDDASFRHKGGCFELLMSFKWGNGTFDMAVFQDFLCNGIFPRVLYVMA
jgi:hypothetical protein